MTDSPSTRGLTAGLLAIAFIFYGLVLIGGQTIMAGIPVPNLDLTFNSMAEHLLAGRFDVDPAIVGKEGFAVNGAVIAYWGVLPAVLRMPLALLPGGQRLDVTAASCWVAVCLAAAIKLETIRLIFRHFESGASRDPAASRLLYWSMVLTILFSGPQIEFLKPSIYQEVCLWAGACAAIFVYFALGGLIQGRFSIAALCAMAIAAGLALLTRVSMGVGLYMACGLLLAILCKTRPAHAAATHLAVPLSILMLFMGIAGSINYGRWGNPLVFADYHRYLFNLEYPDRLARLADYGLFNPTRIPIGLSYYFAPVLFLHTGDGQLILQSQQARLLDFAELPPSSFFLTDPLLLAVLLCGWRTRLERGNRAAVDGTRALAMAVGLGAGGALMLCAISMSHRYRIDFYPLIEFGAFTGLAGLLHRETPPRRGFDIAIAAAAAMGIAASLLVLALYRLSQWGSAIPLLRVGALGYYEHRLAAALAALAH